MNIRELLRCPKCGNVRLDYIKFDDQDFHALKGSITCSQCSLVIIIQNGVLICVGGDEDSSLSKIDKRNQKVYKETWRRGYEAYKEVNLTSEQELFNLWKNYFRANTMMDAGCGAGRLIETYAKLDIDSIIFVDISDAIFQCRENYLKYSKNKYEALFIKASIKNLPIRDNHIDFTLSTGTINITSDQDASLNELFRITKNNFLLGIITDKTLIGKTYIATNVIKPFINRINNFNLLFRISGILSYIVFIFFKMLLLTGILDKISGKDEIKKILGYKKCVSRLRYTIFDPLTVPIITKKEDTFYIDFANRNNYLLIKQTTTSLMDYYLFEGKKDT